MPVVAVVDGVSIRFYWNDHPPPHFHAVLAGETAVVDIRKLQPIAGSLPAAKLRAVTSWAGRHQAELEAAWEAVAAKRKPEKIE